jgi:hypothetical protein
MHSSQQELRQAATRAFMEALDQLDQRLHRPEADDQPSNEPSQGTRSISSAPKAGAAKAYSAAITVQELEDAVADIDQFTRSRSQ